MWLEKELATAIRKHLRPLLSGDGVREAQVTAGGKVTGDCALTIGERRIRQVAGSIQSLGAP